MISLLQQIAGGPDAAPMNLVGMTMLLQFVVSFGFILPVNAPQNMVAYGTDTFTARDFVRTGLVLTVIGFVLVLLLGGDVLVVDGIFDEVDRSRVMRQPDGTRSQPTRNQCSRRASSTSFKYGSFSKLFKFL